MLLITVWDNTNCLWHQTLVHAVFSDRNKQKIRARLVAKDNSCFIYPFFIPTITILIAPGKVLSIGGLVFGCLVSSAGCGAGKNEVQWCGNLFYWLIPFQLFVSHLSVAEHHPIGGIQSNNKKKCNNLPPTNQNFKKIIKINPKARLNKNVFTGSLKELRNEIRQSSLGRKFPRGFFILFCEIKMVAREGNWSHYITSSWCRCKGHLLCLGILPERWKGNGRGIWQAEMSPGSFLWLNSLLLQYNLWGN